MSVWCLDNWSLSAFGDARSLFIDRLHQALCYPADYLHNIKYMYYHSVESLQYIHCLDTERTRESPAKITSEQAGRRLRGSSPRNQSELQNVRNRNLDSPIYCPYTQPKLNCRVNRHIQINFLVANKNTNWSATCPDPISANSGDPRRLPLLLTFCDNFAQLCDSVK